MESNIKFAKVEKFNVNEENTLFMTKERNQIPLEKKGNFCFIHHKDTYQIYFVVRFIKTKFGCYIDIPFHLEYDLKNESYRLSFWGNEDIQIHWRILGNPQRNSLTSIFRDFLEKETKDVSSIFESNF